MMSTKPKLFRIIFFSTIIFLTACQPTSVYTQRATATAYSADYMVSAMQAAENGAMALCNIDFNAGAETYLEGICANSTQLGCAYCSNQVVDVWQNLERTYSTDLLECVIGTSRFLEEGQQFGMHVQYWLVNLEGISGWTDGTRNREYWLQVAEENSQWKLNRVLTSDEIAFYQTVDTMGVEE